MTCLHQQGGSRHLDPGNCCFSKLSLPNCGIALLVFMVASVLSVSSISFMGGHNYFSFSQPQIESGVSISPNASPPDLEVLSWSTYPNPDGGILLHAEVQNQGNLSTQDGFYCGSLTVNNGVSYAHAATVTLNTLASDATSGLSQMQLSNDGTSWSSWEPYSTSRNWTLSSGDGPKSVYARFRELYNGASGGGSIEGGSAGGMMFLWLAATRSASYRLMIADGFSDTSTLGNQLSSPFGTEPVRVVPLLMLGSLAVTLLLLRVTGELSVPNVASVFSAFFSVSMTAYALCRIGSERPPPPVA